MKAKAKTSRTTYPIWVCGEYITKPPVRPSDGAVRPEGHYLDTGGYPGANCYEITEETFCRSTGKLDRLGKEMFERDILLYETEQEIGYFLIWDTETAVDVIWGEMLKLRDLQAEDIKVIGNEVDFPDFKEGMDYFTENGIEIPYLPALSVQESAYPYLKMTCLKCGHTFLSCDYMARHKNCGGHLITDFATKVKKYRKTEKEQAFA